MQNTYLGWRPTLPLITLKNSKVGNLSTSGPTEKPSTDLETIISIVPMEIWLHIFNVLPTAKDRAVFSILNKRFYTIAHARNSIFTPEIEKSKALDKVIEEGNEDEIVQALVNGAIPKSVSDASKEDFNRRVTIYRDKQVLEISLVELLVEHCEVIEADFFVEKGAQLPEAPVYKEGQNLEKFLKNICTDPKKLYLALRKNPTLATQRVGNFSLLYYLLTININEFNILGYLDILFSCQNILFISNEDERSYIFIVINEHLSSPYLLGVYGFLINQMYKRTIAKTDKMVEEMQHSFCRFIYGNDGIFKEPYIETLLNYYPMGVIDLNAFLLRPLNLDPRDPPSNKLRPLRTLLSYLLFYKKYDDAIFLLTKKEVSVLKAKSEETLPMTIVNKQIIELENDIQKAEEGGNVTDIGEVEKLNEFRNRLTKLKNLQKIIVERAVIEEKKAEIDRLNALGLIGRVTEYLFGGVHK